MLIWKLTGPWNSDFCWCSFPLSNRNDKWYLWSHGRDFIQLWFATWSQSLFSYIHSLHNLQEKQLDILFWKSLELQLDLLLVKWNPSTPGCAKLRSRKLTTSPMIRPLMAPEMTENSNDTVEWFQPEIRRFHAPVEVGSLYHFLVQDFFHQQ